MQDSPFAFCWFIKSRWGTVSASIRRIGLQIMYNQFPCELKRDTSQIYVIKSIAERTCPRRKNPDYILFDLHFYLLR